MNLRYAQDYTAGDVFDLGTYDVTQEEIIEERMERREMREERREKNKKK